MLSSYHLRRADNCLSQPLYSSINYTHAIICTHLLIHTLALDGRGFAAQRKDAAAAGRAELETNIFSGELEISSSQFAIVSAIKACSVLKINCVLIV